jgi:hypothetical protein
MIKQGHKYSLFGRPVIAFESGHNQRVRVGLMGDPLFSGWMYANACDLSPLPMAYFHGQTPK